MTDGHPKPKTKQSRQGRRSKATHHKLLQAARTVFAEKGIDLARIDEIAERADVGKGTFYYYFTGKPQIVRELLTGMLKELTTAIQDKCGNVSGIQDLLDKLIGAHIEFFSSRWEDFVLYFQGRSDLTLQEGYPGIETPFIDYLEYIESLLESVLKYRLPQPVLRRIACAITGFVSGYYSFAVIGSQDDNVDEVFASLRGAMVASLSRFVQETSPPTEKAASSQDKR